MVAFEFIGGFNNKWDIFMIFIKYESLEYRPKKEMCLLVRVDLYMVEV